MRVTNARDVMRKRSVYVALLIAACVILCIAAVVAQWGLRSWIWGAINRHALASTQCVLVSAEVCSRLAGRKVVGERDVTAVVADMASDMARVDDGRFSSDAGQLLDPWGNPLSVKVERVEQHYVVYVRSAGPDGIMGNGDDFLWDRHRWRIDDGSQSPAGDSHVP